MRNPQGHHCPGYQRPPTCRYGLTGATKRVLFPLDLLGGARGCNKHPLISTGIHYLSVTHRHTRIQKYVLSQIGFAERTGRDFETSTVAADPCLKPRGRRPAVFRRFLRRSSSAPHNKDSRPRSPSAQCQANKLDKPLACTRLVRWFPLLYEKVPASEIPTYSPACF